MWVVVRVIGSVNTTAVHCVVKRQIRETAVVGRHKRTDLVSCLYVDCTGVPCARAQLD